MTTPTITTDKAEYNRGEIVKIAILNNSFSSQKEIYPPFYAIERFNNGNWIEIKGEVRLCPCNALCKTVSFLILKAGERIDYEWNQKEEWCQGEFGSQQTIRNQVPSGKHRVKSEISNSEAPYGRETIYSNEFTIK